MTDPLSIAGSIAGLISIADVVFRKSYQYIKTVKRAEKEILGFKNEIAALTGVLHNLHLVAEELEDDSTFDNAVKIDHVASCSTTLQRIDSLLSKIQFSKDHKIQNALHRLKWPFKLTETKDLGDEVRRHRETLSLAISADSMVALLQCLSSQKDIINQLDRIEATLQKNKDTQLGIALDEDRRRILKSFFAVEPRQYYETSLQLRHSGTGSWLYQNTTFQSWLQEPGNKLWLTGIPGAGKTVLSGMIIQECLAKASANEAVAYYYCDYNNLNSQNIVNIFSALAGQIAMRNEDSFELLREYHDQLHSRDQMERYPTTEELIKLIQKMASGFDDVRVIVDGLDECGNAMTAAAESLQTLVYAPRATISLALISRKEEAIRDVLEDDDTFTHIEITAHRDDIESFVRSEIEQRTQRRRLRIRNAELKLLIVQELVSKADGMFRWVACQLDHLCDLATDSQRRKALTELPKTLQESYERILLRIKKPVVPLVAKTLQWLAYATPKIEIDALLEALSIDDDSDILDPEARPSEEDILQHCSSLIRKTGAHLELAHFTVQEYLQTLTTDHDQLGQFSLSRDSKAVLAKTCLSYLCLPAFAKPPGPLLDDIVSFREQYPFHIHASISWYGYMENLWDDTGLRQLYRRLFGPWGTPNLVLCTVQRLMGKGVTKGRTIQYNDSKTLTVVELVNDETFQPIHAAAIFGLTEVCQWLVGKGADVNLPSPLGEPLKLLMINTLGLYTVYGTGSTPVDESAIAATAILLVESGAHYSHGDMDHIRDFTGSPDYEFSALKALRSFQERTENGVSTLSPTTYTDDHEQKLLHWIANDQAERVKNFWKDKYLPTNKGYPDDGWKFMFWAVAHGAVQTMTMFLDIGLDPTHQDDGGKNILFYSLDFHDQEVLSRLIAYPSMAAPAENGQTIWHVAASGGRFQMLELLVKLRSKAGHELIDLYDDKTPLIYAILSGNESCCLLLVQAMQAQGQTLDDPVLLHSCIAMGFSQVLQQLLDYGHDIRTVTGDLRSALFFVTPSTTNEMFETLLSNGMDPLDRDASSKTPFHALLDGTRHANMPKSSFKRLNDRNAPILQMDAVTSSMLDHLLTPTSANSKDNQGHTIWFYFCTKYIPRIIENQDILVSDTLEELTKRLVLNNCIEAYEEADGARNGAGLLIETCLGAFKGANDWGQGLISRLLFVIITDEGVTISAGTQTMADLLVWSIKAKEKRIFHILLDLGVDVHKRNDMSSGHSALMASASGYGDYDMFINLMKHVNSDRLGETDGSGWTPIHATCYPGVDGPERLKRLKALLEAGADPNSRTTDNNRTVLHLAAHYDLVEGVRVLLQHKADPAQRDNNGWGTVAHAVHGGSSEVLQLLETQYSDDPTVHDCDHRYTLADAIPYSHGCTLFHLATDDDQVEMLEYLKTSGRLKNIHEPAEDGKTPLHLAAITNAVKSTEWLIQNGADVNAKTSEMQLTALHSAVARGHFSIVRLLVSAGAEFLEDKKQRTPFHLVRQGRESELFKALEGLHVPDLVQMNLLSAEVQPFFTAIDDENIEACRMMIRKDPKMVSIPSLDCGVCTPLITALVVARSEIVTLLLENDATTAGYRCSKHSSNNLDTYEASSVQLAIQRPDLNSRLPLLLDMWSQQQSNRWNGVTPVHFAAAFNPEAIDIVHDNVIARAECYPDFEFHKPADFRSYHRVPPWGLDRAPPLVIAVHNKKFASVARLLSYGADVGGRDWRGFTALHIAARENFFDIAEILLTYGADPNARDQWLCTPLMLCADWADVDLAKLLLSHGADKHAKADSGETALHMAAVRGHFEMFVLLLQAGCDASAMTRPGGNSALSSALQHPHMATYVYAKGFSLEHMTPTDPVDFALVYWKSGEPSYLKRLLRYLPEKDRAKFINHETKFSPVALAQAASADDVTALHVLIKAGADIEFPARNGYGSALIAACAIHRFDSVKCLVYYGAKYESTIDGAPITALQAARKSPQIVHWLLVGRYTEQSKLTNFAAQTDQHIRSWAGVRQLEIKLDGFYNRSHRQAFQSLFEYVCWIYGQRDSWRQMVPLAWKPEAHFAALPGEHGNPLEARFARCVKDEVQE